MSKTPFEEDSQIMAAAAIAGMEVLRQQPITITDRKALDAAGLMRKSPDYPKIRALLNSGVKVEGASLGPVEYVLRHPSITEDDLNVSDADVEAILAAQRLAPASSSP